MYLNKQQLIEMVNNRYGDDDLFDVTYEVCAPVEGLSTLGCEFGSAEHMIRRPKKHEHREDIRIEATVFTSREA